MALSAGTVLRDDIELEKELGRGGMGVVWTAVHRRLDARVAVKILKATGLSSAEARARFEREAKSIAKVDSPHVVRIFDVGVSDEGDPFIVMELLRGRDLKSHIAELGPLSLEDAVAFVKQTCAALGCAHAAGIVHRDIKPANLFLADGGAGLFVKVLDFGIAKVADAQGLGLTQTESLMGTPYYMSPEQFIDPRQIDHRSDLWSVAVVTYAALTGKLPFVGESVGALALEVHAGEFRPPSELRPELPASVDAWFRRALAPEQDQRYASAAELAASFARAIAGKHEEARPAAASKPANMPLSVTTPGPRPEPAMEPAPPSHAQTNAEPPKVPEQTLAAQVTTPAEAPRSRVPLVALSLLVLGGVFAAGYGMSRMGRDDVTPAGPASTTNEAIASTVRELPSSAIVAPSTSSGPTVSAHAAAPSAARVGLIPAPAPTGSDLAPGARCAQAAQCRSGFCVDGVCCATACTQKCFACSGVKVRGRPEAQQDGTCGFIDFGFDPDNECAGSLICDGLGRCGEKSAPPF